MFLGVPGMDKTPGVNQSDNRHHDDRRQNRLRQVVKQRGQEEQGDDDNDGGDDAGYSGHGTGLEVDRRAGEGAGNRVA